MIEWMAQISSSVGQTDCCDAGFAGPLVSLASPGPWPEERLDLVFGVTVLADIIWSRRQRHRGYWRSLTRDA